MAKEKKLSDVEKVYLAALGAISDLREKIKEAGEKLKKAKKDVEKKGGGKASKEETGEKCACGCGMPTKKGSKFVRGHNFKK